MKKLCIFDFDGTVVDTITDVAICFNQALEAHGFPTHPLTEYGGFIGGNLETVVSRLLPQEQITQENVDLVKNTYRMLYLASTKPNSKPYPGMMSLLDTLKGKGFLLAINSNKGQELLNDMVGKIFPVNYFDAVVGYAEDRPSKPDPYGVDMICRICGCTREDAVYIGDGASDIHTASNAQIPCVFVCWGQGSKEDASDPKIYARAKNAEELRRILLEE